MLVHITYFQTVIFPPFDVSSKIIFQRSRSPRDSWMIWKYWTWSPAVNSRTTAVVPDLVPWWIDLKIWDIGMERATKTLTCCLIVFPGESFFSKFLSNTYVVSSHITYYVLYSLINCFICATTWAEKNYLDQFSSYTYVVISRVCAWLKLQNSDFI